ncbi:MAG: hypothetical protein U9O94_02645 [Nanoarchaeota archaeon]|nr:hypothetical protein [Nanoarchaeota archaeon]
MSEKKLETAILDYLSYIKEGYFFKVNTMGVYDPTIGKHRKNMNKYAINGISDILGCFMGVFMAMEVKLPSNKKRPDAQIDFINMINKTGGKAGFVTSIVEVDNLLKEVIKDNGN